MTSDFIATLYLQLQAECFREESDHLPLGPTCSGVFGGGGDSTTAPPWSDREFLKIIFALLFTQMNSKIRVTSLVVTVFAC